MENKDIRWIQRLNSYSKALENLSLAIDLSSQRTLSDLEEQGFIKGFELVYELAWLPLKIFINMWEKPVLREAGMPLG